MSTKEKLDAKSNTIIATSGTVATLFMGFGIFLMKDIGSGGLFFIPAIVILLSEIILTAFTMKYAIEAHRIAEFFYPFETIDFLNQDHTVNRDKLKHFLNAPEDKLEIEVASVYWDCIRDNEKTNKQKAGNIVKSQNFLILSVSLIPFFAFVIIFARFL